jgi:hypothetical protein
MEINFSQREGDGNKVLPEGWGIRKMNLTYYLGGGLTF